MSDFAKITHVLAADTHNLKILENGFTERVLLVPTGADRALTGIQPPPNGMTRLLGLVNTSSQYAVFLDRNSSSSEEQNRFAFAGTVRPGELALLFYEPSLQRWKAFTGGTSVVNEVDHLVMIASDHVDGSDNLVVSFFEASNIMLVLDQDVNNVQVIAPALALNRAATIRLFIAQGSGAPWEIASWTGAKFPDDVPPTLSRVEDYVDMIAAVYNGTDGVTRFMDTTGWTS